jgi:hypothetical protein
MAYVINKTDGTQLVVLQDAAVDSTTSLSFVGRNYVGYGEIQNENFLFLLENFANISAPGTPITGQVWFDTTNSILKVYDGENWVEVGSANVSPTAPVTPALGTFWLKNETTANAPADPSLHVYDGSNWIKIGPETADGYLPTRAVTTTLLATNGTTYPVIELKVNGVTIGIVSSNAFTIDPSNEVSGFSELITGINLNAMAKVMGTLQGVADKAIRLNSPILVNGVAFDGSENLTITAQTPNSLVAGEFLVGTDFDGGNPTTWSVDATHLNQIGKIVSRDTTGNFVANQITSDLVGNVTGNITGETGSFTGSVTAANFIGATLSGTAAAAQRLSTPANINGVGFDGTADITVTADANTLTGTNLHNTVTSSALTSLGTLTSLGVAGNITVGSNLTIDGTINSTEIKAANQISLAATEGVDYQLDLFGPTRSPSAKAGLLPNTDVVLDLGSSALRYKDTYSEKFYGDLTGAVTGNATSATTATNIAGGAGGTIPYQTASGSTAHIPSGTAGKFLKSTGAGQPVWDTIAFSNLTPGNYLTGLVYDGITNTTFDVDATNLPTANKVVARDANGDFSANVIQADLNGNAATATTASTATSAVNATQAANANSADNATYSITRANADSSTFIATTEFVQNVVASANTRQLVISSPAPNTSSPDAQYIDLIEAYLPASQASGLNFELIINNIYAGSSSSFSAGRWILAYRWATASVSTSTTLYNSNTGYKLTYSSNGSNWSYTGTWSYV